MARQKSATNNNSSSVALVGPLKSALKPTKTYNNDDPIDNWKADSHDGRALVAPYNAGLMDHMTPNEIRTVYPQFNKYAYATFSSALSGVKKQTNKIIQNRSKVMAGNCKYTYYCNDFYFFITNNIISYSIVC